MENKSKFSWEIIGVIVVVVLLILYYIGAGSAIYNALGGGRLGIWGILKLL